MRKSLEAVIHQYQKHLYATALNICRNPDDANDVVQDTFLQYFTTEKEFNDEEHLKAWLFRTAINRAKDITRMFWRKNRLPLEEFMEAIVFENPQDETLFEEVMKLPEKYRIVIHLYYYEDLSVRQIAGLLKVSEGNVKMRLSRGRGFLKNILKEEEL